MPKKVLLHEFSTTEYQEQMEKGLLDSVICCFGSCESHGWHLPFNPDIIVPMDIATKAAQKLSKTVVAPGMPFGASVHYNHFPMSITIEYETMIKVAEDIFSSLIKHNLKHIYILNGHDGNIPLLEIAARNVKNKHPDTVFVYTPAWWDIVSNDKNIQPMFKTLNGLGHGGEGETSVVMAVRPDLVNVSLAVNQTPEAWSMPKNSSIIADISELSNSGNTGDGTKGDRELGKKMIDCVVDYVVDYIQTLENKSWRYDYKK